MMPDEETPDAPTLCWATGHLKTTVHWSPINDQRWSSFVKWLCPEMPASKKEVLPYVGATLEGGRRTIGTVEQRFFLTLDADYADELFPTDVGVEFLNTPYLIHSTWRHSILAHRYRLIIPLSRGVDSQEYKELAWAVMNLLDGSRFDPTTAQAERFMWGPSSQNMAEYYWISANPRAPYLPVDAWLEGQHGPSDAPAAGGRANPPPTTRATGSGALDVTDEDRERAHEILLKACNEVEQVYEQKGFAGRNEAVFHLLPLLLRFAAAGAIEEDTVLDALWTAARRVPADEPYRRQEFIASFRKASEYAQKAGPALPETTPTRLAQADFENVDVVQDLWDKTPILKHIAQAGDAMGRNRLALLAVTLTRILAEVDPEVCLPGVEDGGIGTRAPLNLGVALVGASGQGKSGFFKNSELLLGHSQQSIERSPSTGQGLIQSYLTWDSDQSENVLVDDPRRLFIVDEIEKLGALGSDQGSTLLGEIRTMLTGGSTGSSNATKERQRMLHAGTYNFQLVVGVQPARAGALLDGHHAGTPQRFIWVTVTDPKTALHPDDRPPWPGSLDWSDAFLLGFEVGEPLVRYPEWLVKELKEYDYRVSQEKSHGGKLSRFGHQNLLRLKVAAGIAFLHESSVIEDLHIEIADLILVATRHTQVECERMMMAIADERKKAAIKSDERIREEVGEEKLTRMITNAHEKLLRQKGEWITWHALRPAHRDRGEYEEPVWEGLKAMEGVEHEETQHGQRVRRRMRVTE